LLEASVDSLLISEDTLPRISSEKEQLQRSVRNLTQDLENAERRLEQERSARYQLEESRE
jgi:homeobox protein cut-like